MCTDTIYPNRAQDQLTVKKCWAIFLHCYLFVKTCTPLHVYRHYTSWLTSWLKTDIIAIVKMMSRAMFLCCYLLCCAGYVQLWRALESSSSSWAIFYTIFLLSWWWLLYYRHKFIFKWWIQSQRLYTMSCLLNHTMLPMPSSTDTTGLAYYWLCVLLYMSLLLVYQVTVELLSYSNWNRCIILQFLVSCRPYTESWAIEALERASYANISGLCLANFYTS